MHLCFCPGVAGCCAKTTIAPLDRVKILLQAQNPHYKHLGKHETSAPRDGLPQVVPMLDVSASFMENCFCFTGVFSTLKAVPQKEGYLGLYKGNGAMMVRIFPYGAIQFMAFDNYKKVQLPFVSSVFTESPFFGCAFAFLFCNFCICKGSDKSLLIGFIERKLLAAPSFFYSS